MGWEIRTISTPVAKLTNTTSHVNLTHHFEHNHTSLTRKQILPESHHIGEEEPLCGEDLWKRFSQNPPPEDTYAKSRRGGDRVTYCDILPRTGGGWWADQNSPRAIRGLTIAVLMGCKANGGPRSSGSDVVQCHNKQSTVNKRKKIKGKICA